MSDGVTIEFTPNRGSRKRIRYEPRAHNAGYWRICEEWNGCRWRIQGREPVHDLVCEDDEVVLE